MQSIHSTYTILHKYTYTIGISTQTFFTDNIMPHRYIVPYHVNGVHNK